MVTRHLYSVTARLPWGLETYQIAATDHLAAVDYVERQGQPAGETRPIVLTWERIDK